jgi:hypothetical protein
MATTPEGKVKKDVKKLLKALKQRGLAHWFMPSASIYGKAGAHDFICCIRGRFVTIETKSGNIKPTDLQIDFGKETITAQGISYKVYPKNFEAVAREILDWALKGIPLKGHDFSIYDRKPKRRTNRRVSEPVSNSESNP